VREPASGRRAWVAQPGPVGERARTGEGWRWGEAPLAASLRGRAEATAWKGESAVVEPAPVEWL